MGNVEAIIEAYAEGLHRQLRGTGVVFALVVCDGQDVPEGQYRVFSNTEPVAAFLEDHARRVQDESFETLTPAEV